ncbi:MAG: fumarylacetoacetase [Bacteroidetes bacterium QS_8_68_15]|nr:MAG: fumarylacetoacetase [Bacteroidetes bacterium QS_8_68_15]
MPDAFLDVPSDSHFPIQNLPYGIFRPQEGVMPRVGTAIGEHVLDLSALESRELFAAHPQIAERHPFSQPSLNTFMSMGPDAWQFVRWRLTALLQEGSALHESAELRERALFDRDDPDGGVEMLLPAQIGDYTDFYSSEEHATNIGTMFRGAENALKPNWKHLPVGYHGRASSVVVSGTSVRRPCGQTRPDDDEPPVFGPTKLLDFELEMGFFVGPGNRLGESIPIERASDHIFGMALVNDWSARDIQGFEYVPLGPFLGKSFATSVSPWIVPMAALEPFRTSGPEQDPTPQDYLRSDREGAYDIHLEAYLAPAGAGEAQTICRTNFGHLYWTAQQQLAHHTVNGCNTRPGDLMASGTISGPTEDSYGSLLELTWRGENPISFSGGTERTFLEDGDRLILTGWAEHEEDGYRVGFGECTGEVLPAEEC